MKMFSFCGLRFQRKRKEEKADQSHVLNTRYRCGPMKISQEMSTRTTKVHFAPMKTKQDVSEPMKPNKDMSGPMKSKQGPKNPGTRKRATSKKQSVMFVASCQL